MFDINRRLTCTHNGVYVFHLSLMAGVKRCAVFMHHQKERMRVLALDKDTTSQASNMIVIECRRGENVWVQSCNDGASDFEETASMTSLFSGFLQHHI